MPDRPRVFNPPHGPECEACHPRSRGFDLLCASLVFVPMALFWLLVVLGVVRVSG